MLEIYENSFKIPIVRDHKNLLSHLNKTINSNFKKEEVPIRFIISATNDNDYHCEVGVIKFGEKSKTPIPPSIFSFEQRKFQRTDQFNIALMVPTGIGAEIGGHAGDACPVSRMLGNLCDHLITHPNVVNASDYNEMPENALYVEGSILCRLLMGTVALEKVRSNNVLLIMEKSEDPSITNDYINCLNAARAHYGLVSPLIVAIAPPLRMIAEYTSTGRAVGRISELTSLKEALNTHLHSCQALAFATLIKVPASTRDSYWDSEGKIINPWGGVEAIFTHAISALYNLPSAHAPMVDAQELKECGIAERRQVMDPRMSAEILSGTFLQCVLKGLQKSPRIITDPSVMHKNGLLTVEDVSCLVIPDGCLGLPTLAALEQGIPVIAVKENRNLMRNDLSQLPWAPGQFYQVENYWEAAGVITAIKAGLCPHSVRRPLSKASFLECTHNKAE